MDFLNELDEVVIFYMSVANCHPNEAFAFNRLTFQIVFV